MAQCLQCGYDLVSETKFCGRCGAQVSIPTPDKSETLAATGLENVVPSDASPQAPRPRNNGLVAVFGCVVVALIIGLVIVTLSGGSSKKRNNANTGVTSRVATCEDILNSWVSWYGAVAFSPNVDELGSANVLIQRTLYQETTSGMGGVINLYAWVQVQAVQPGTVQSVSDECAALRVAGYDGASLPLPPR